MRIGITGGIGSGKSTIAKVFQVLGAPVFKADEEGKKALNEDPELIEAVKGRFGSHIYRPHGIDRKALARIVFNDRKELEALNELVHPRVRDRFQEWCKKRSDEPYVVEEAAILIESGGYREMDHLILVTAPEEMRVQRVVERDGSDPEAVRARMKEQMSEEAKRPFANSILPNDDSRLLLPEILELDSRFRQEETD